MEISHAKVLMPTAKDRDVLSPLVNRILQYLAILPPLFNHPPAGGASHMVTQMTASVVALNASPFLRLAAQVTEEFQALL
jgi:hypothetical protein